MRPTVLDRIAQETGAVPLGWAGASPDASYVNLGDALSPVMVALCTGLGIMRVPFRSTVPRLAAVGTIGHGFAGGDVWFWGTCASLYRNPLAPAAEKQRYRTPPGTRVHIAATRGPISEAILRGEGALAAPGVYGDPVWLLPRFHRPAVPKRHELGVILHLSDLTDRSFDVHFNPLHQRYVVPPDLAGAVRLISTVTPPDLPGLFARIDDILACRRIVSTSLHGLVFAESYGIPCLYFGVGGAPDGLGIVPARLETGIDLRILDLYAGLGLESFPLYVQRRRCRTDWAAVIRAIDRAWEQRHLDEAALLAALPVSGAPVTVPADGSSPGPPILEHPVLRGLRLTHSAEEIAEAVRRTGAIAGEPVACAP